ncbi:MAG: GDP-mannose 4,6-dehydratase [Halobacteriales archaeon]
MDVLVTGGAGFIGSHLSQALLEAGHAVTVIDNLDPYYEVGIKERNVDYSRGIGGDRYRFVEGSITNEAQLRSLFADRSFDMVYHEAAQAGVRTSVENPQKPHAINTTALLTLLQLADEHGVERFVNASSSSVYGVPKALPYDEAHPTEPQSPYAVTKLAAEHYARVWNDLYGLPTVNLRYFTVYGPRMRPNMAITNFTSRCLNGEPPVIYGDGQQTRDFTYIDDVVDANLSLLETDVADGETLNIGSTDNLTIQALAEYIIEETGADVDPVFDSAKAGDARHTHADVSKARELLGYDPSVDIREGVSRFIDWYQENRDWYEPLVLAS